MFINRQEELSILKIDIQTIRKSNRINIIKGETGIGKSSFTQKVLSELDKKNYIKVKIGNHMKNIGQGLFLQLIGKEINKHVKEVYPRNDLNHYLKLRPNSIKESLIDILFEDMKLLDPLESSTKSIKKILDYKFNKGKFDENQILNNGSPNSLLILSEFIKDFLNKNKPFIINVENFHLIDNTSFELISQIIGDTSNNYYLLEYTSNGDQNIDEFLGQLSTTNSEILITELPRLSREDFRKIIKSREENIDRMVDYIYDEYHGNIRQLADLKILINDKVQIIDFQKSTNANTTLFNLYRIDANSVFVLAVIVSTIEKLNIEKLNLIHQYDKSLYIDIQSTINILSSRDLIEILGNGSIHAKHDTIHEIIKENFKSKYLLANKFWSDYFIELWTNQKFEEYSKSRILSNIFNHLIISNPNRLVNFLNPLKKHILGLMFPSSIMGYISELYSFITGANIDSNSLNDTIYFFIIDIYYQTNFFKEALELLDSLKQNTLGKQIYKLILLNRLDLHDEVINECELILKGQKSNMPNNYLLSVKIILLTSYRSKLEFGKWTKLNNSILKDFSYRYEKEYSIFLRNTEMVLSYKDSLKYLNESINLSEKNGDKEEEAYARMAYSMQLGRLGRLEQAKKESELSRNLLAHKMMDRHMILNNLATIELLRKNYSKNVENQLKQALVTAFDSFSILNIKSNLLVLFTMRNEWENCETIIAELQNILPNQMDMMLIRIIFFNIAFYYKRRNNAEEYEKFMSKAENCMEDKDSLWKFRFYNKKINDANNLFYSTFPYHVDFLTHWHFSIDSNYENFPII